MENKEAFCFSISFIDQLGEMCEHRKRRVEGRSCRWQKGSREEERAEGVGGRRGVEKSRWQKGSREEERAEAKTGGGTVLNTNSS